MRRVALTALLAVGIAPGAQAQMMMSAPEATAASEKWTYLIAPYFLVPKMDGEIGVGSTAIDVSAGPGDIFDKLDFGFMIYSEARKGPWAFALDVLYMDLGDQGKTPLATYDVTMKQAGYMFEVYRRLGPRVEAMAGATVNHLSTEFSTSGPFALDAGDSKTWVDPIVGGRVELLRTPKWGISLTGGVGGFGVGSEFVWQVYPVLSYRAGSGIDLGFAYRACGMDYETGSGNTEFSYDMTTFGPELGIGFRF